MAGYGFTTSPLDKQFYLGFKAIKKKYKLEKDREVLECLIWFALDKGTRTMQEVVDQYLTSAPSDTTLPEAG